jgi:hypothetical protein
MAVGKPSALLVFLSLIIATIVGRIIYGTFEKPILRVINSHVQKAIRVFAVVPKNTSEKRLSPVNRV